MHFDGRYDEPGQDIGPDQAADGLFVAHVDRDTFTTMSGPVKFTSKCHRPQPPSHIFELYTNGKAKSLGRVYAHNIPSIGDGNPCAGKQAAPSK